MAYTPYEWTVNSYLNPTRMNAIEQGIAEASQAAESASGEFHTIEELIGTQSIAGIGDGTLTGATWKINNDLTELSGVVTTLNSNLTPTKVSFSDYFSVASGFTLLNENLYKIGRELHYYIEIGGSITPGQTVIGSVQNKFLMNGFAAGRLATPNGASTYSCSVLAINGGQLRTYSEVNVVNVAFSGVMLLK